MIHQIRSDLKTFKTLNFRQGLNILVAHKSEGATNLQTRNSTGKSSLVELIHFVCGSNADIKSIFRSDKLKDVNFDIVLDIKDEKITVGRSGKEPATIQVSGHVKNWPIPPKSELSSNIYEFSNENWKHILGNLWFGLAASPDDKIKYQPTFRSLFSYLVRRQEVGGFQQHKQYTNKQQNWNQQVAISYLLGLDWHIPKDIQLLKDEEKKVKSLKIAADSGVLGAHFEPVADLQTKLIIRSQRVKQLREQLNEFKIISEYSEIELEANKITGELNQIGEENFIDLRTIDELNLTLHEEVAPDSSDLTKLYEEAGIVLPDLLQKRLDDVKKFHQTIIKNRRLHLGAELTSTKQRVDERLAERINLDARRSQIMNILQSGGALEQYNAMSEELGRAESDVETIRQRLETAKELESAKARLAIEQNRLTQAWLVDIQERSVLLEEAINTFEELSQSLYEQAGSLIIGAGNSGPTFDIKIDGQKSKGINNMQIFCFDLMLMELCHARGQSSGFLVHDSHLFDGVDERQVAKALQLGAERAKKAGFQYIVTMNSDKIPKEVFDHGFNVNDYVLSTELTDAKESGGLFGIRF